MRDKNTTSTKLTSAQNHQLLVMGVHKIHLVSLHQQGKRKPTPGVFQTPPLIHAQDRSIPESHLRQSVRSPTAKEHRKPTPQEAHSPVPGSGRRRPSFSPGLGAQDEVPAPPRGRNWNAWRGHTLHPCVPDSSKVASETSRPQEGWRLGKHRALGSGPRVACTASTRIFCERWLREREGRWR